MSMIEKWTAVDQYMSDVLIPKDSTLEEVLQENATANLRHMTYHRRKVSFTIISTNSRSLEIF